MDMENRMIELKNRKQGYLQNIYDLTLAQKQALEDDDIEKLKRFIEEKQKFIDKINRIDSELSSVKGENGDEGRDILKSIMEIDRENRQKADQVLLDLKEKLGKVRRGKKVHKAYNPYNSQSAFINKAR